MCVCVVKRQSSTYRMGEKKKTTFRRSLFFGIAMSSHHCWRMKISSYLNKKLSSWAMQIIRLYLLKMCVFGGVYEGPVGHLLLSTFSSSKVLSSHSPMI